MSRADGLGVGEAGLRLRYRATKPHDPEYPVPLQVKRGAKLAFERRPTPWKGWIWCTSPEGRSAWVPESWVTIERDACIASRDYDSTELALQAGEEVVSDIAESGWVWVRDSQGNRGWVPLDCLEPMGDNEHSP